MRSGSAKGGISVPVAISCARGLPVHAVTGFEVQCCLALKSRAGSAVARKIGAVGTAEEFLKSRAGKAKRDDLTRLLDRAPNVPPTPEDAINGDHAVD